MSDNWIVQNLNSALSTWSEKMAELWTLLTENPATFKGGGIWRIMTNINDALTAIGKNFIRSYIGVCLEGAIIALACIIFSAYAASPPAVGDTELSAVTIVWNYVGELVFNLLVLVGAIKASDRIVREMMGLGG